MGLAPNPCEAESTGDPDLMRKVWCCPGYRACLDVACAGNWRTFTCLACAVYVRYFNRGPSLVAYARIVRKVTDG